jgi:hypothetical protein
MRLLLRWLLLLALLLPPSAHAVQSSTLGTYPTGALGSPAPWFQYDLAPEQSAEGSVTVDNRSEAPQDVELYAVDAAPNGDGGFGMMPQAMRPADAGGWIHLGTTSLHLLPKTQQAVPFQFTVPARASVGPHYAGIIVQPVTPAAPSHEGINLRVVPRLGVRLYETVPGHAHPGLAIVSLRPTENRQRITFATVLRNDGNTMLAPTGQLRLTTLFGQAVTLQFNAGRSVAPGQQIEVLLPSNLSTGGFPRHYTARLRLDYGVPSHYYTATRTVRFWAGDVIGWVAGLSLLLSVAAGVAVKQCRRRHRNRHRGNQRQT